MDPSRPTRDSQLRPEDFDFLWDDDATVLAPQPGPVATVAPPLAPQPIIGRIPPAPPRGFTVEWPRRGDGSVLRAWLGLLLGLLGGMIVLASWAAASWLRGGGR